MFVLDFLPLEIFEDVAFEHARTAEETYLGITQRQIQVEFGLKKFQSADKVCNLKKFVLSRLDRLGKFNWNGAPFSKELV